MINLLEESVRKAVKDTMNENGNTDESKETNESKNDENKLLEDFFSKEEVTIVVTDIGLGGMSVFDYIEYTLSNKSTNNERVAFKSVNLVYWNSQVPDRYTLHPIEEQISKFDNQLNMIEKDHNPDIILIACNTLSVIYNATPFYSKTKIPILSIVDFGVKLFNEKLLNDKQNNLDSIMVIYGTATTAKVGQHKKIMKQNVKMVESGIDMDKYIILQGCKGGATNIQGKGADSDEVKILIDGYVKDSYEQIKNKKLELKLNTKIYAGLCCTHYGYAYPFWMQSLVKYKKENCVNEMKANEMKDDTVGIEIINPNDSMGAFITDNKLFKCNEIKTKIKIKLSVFSPNCLLEKIERESIGKLLKANSANVLLKCEGEGSKVLPKDEILKKLQQQKQEQASKM
eukprot:532878_1